MREPESRTDGRRPARRRGRADLDGTEDLRRDGEVGAGAPLREGARGSANGLGTDSAGRRIAGRRTPSTSRRERSRRTGMAPTRLRRASGPDRRVEAGRARPRASALPCSRMEPRSRARPSLRGNSSRRASSPGASTPRTRSRRGRRPRRARRARRARRRSGPSSRDQATSADRASQSNGAGGAPFSVSRRGSSARPAASGCLRNRARPAPRSRGEATRASPGPKTRARRRGRRAARCDPRETCGSAAR